MASLPAAGGENESAREEQRVPQTIVYTRKAKRTKHPVVTATAAPTPLPPPPTTTATDVKEVEVVVQPNLPTSPGPTVTTAAAAASPAAETITVAAADDVLTTTTTAAIHTTTTVETVTDGIANTAGEEEDYDVEIIETDNNDDANNKKSNGDIQIVDIDNRDESNSIQEPVEILPLQDLNSAEQAVVSQTNDERNNLSCLSMQNAVINSNPGLGNGAVKQGLDSKVKINLLTKSKREMIELRKKLEGELVTVRSLVRKIDAKEADIRGFNLSHSVMNDTPYSKLMRVHSEVGSHPGMKEALYSKLTRVHSEVGSVGVPHEVFRQSRPLDQLNVSVLDNSQVVSEHVEKEKRTPKANQFYRDSEFFLAKDKFPPAESNKKSKSNGRKHTMDTGLGFGSGTKFHKRCASLLEKLMKHKHGWVFNAPVDVKALGLHDYFTIIKHPMDLGTIKSKLNKNWYKSPKEFAEDVRLTFRNAMTYNPPGQDVHIMAEQLSLMFEEKWVTIEADYNRETRFGGLYEMNPHTPTARKKTLPVPPPLDMRRILDRTESMTHSFDSRPRPVSNTPTVRTPAPKKPKAKDPNKRDMTYDEKQKLSMNLSNLPAEKLDAIVQIIRKRNASLCQRDDEIEVDIDSVDTETLWELDRFVTNYKKSLSKNKRKAERAMQARAEAEQNIQTMTTVPSMVEVPNETATAERNVPPTVPVQVENQTNNRSRTSSSSSSSSDSGSSSSDSDSDSSSASGSDAGHSP